MGRDWEVVIGKIGFVDKVVHCMRRVRCFVAMLTVLSVVGPEALGGELIYLASTEGKSVVSYRLDSQTGTLTQSARLELPGKAGPMAFSPARDFLYVGLFALDKKGCGVATLRRSKNGTLKLIGTSRIKARTCYIRADPSGRFLLAAHYGTGEVTIYRIKKGICQSDCVQSVTVEKTSHCVEFGPDGRFVYVPHTKPNKIYQFQFNKKQGQLTALRTPFALGPAVDQKVHQPRHVLFHSKLKMAFSSNERGGGITAWRLNAKSGELTRSQTLSTLPAGTSHGTAAADIRLSPNGRFIYVSNRDLTKRKLGDDGLDTLAAFSIDPKTGALASLGHVKTVRFPRSMCINKAGDFLFAAGQKSHTVFGYKIKESGHLVYLKSYKTEKAPIWIMSDGF
jgi:6-phosphogluconolactonase